MERTVTAIPCCSYAGLNKGPWTPEEDLRLINYIAAHGEGNWRTLPTKAGLLRCGMGCRLRWMNYLRPNVERGNISPHEEEMIIRLYKLLGNRWSLIARRIPGRTDNEVKNYWNTHLRKKFSATKGFTRNARAVLCQQPGFKRVAPTKKISKGTINPVCANQRRSSFSPYKDGSSSFHAIKDEKYSGSASWDIKEIVSILMGDEDLCKRREYVATGNSKQSIDGFHETMDLSTTTINHYNYHTGWAHGSQHQSSIPIIYSPDFQACKTCPSDCMIGGGLYQQCGITSMEQQEHNIVSANINNGVMNPTGDTSNLQPKNAAEAEIQVHIPPYGLIHEDNFMAIDCNVFDQCSISMALPELGENMSLKSCLQPEDPTANHCSETWVSSFDWIDCIQPMSKSVPAK